MPMRKTTNSPSISADIRESITFAHPDPNGTLKIGFDTVSDNAAIVVGQAMRAAGCHE